jgi:hypothetical protein
VYCDDKVTFGVGLTVTDADEVFVLTAGVALSVAKTDTREVIADEPALVPDTVQVVFDAPQPLTTESPAPSDHVYVSSPVPPEGVTVNVVCCPLSIVTGDIAVNDGLGLTVTDAVPDVPFPPFESVTTA